MSTKTYLEKIRNKKKAYGELNICIDSLCSNTSSTTPNKIFIRIPEESYLRKKWLEAFGKNIQDYRFEKIFCCEDHFNLPDDMSNWKDYARSGGKMYFKAHVVPRRKLGPIKYVKVIIEGQQKLAVSLLKQKTTTENLQMEKTTENALNSKTQQKEIKVDLVNIKDPPVYELVQNYTKEFFLVPLSENEKQKQKEPPFENLKIVEDENNHNNNETLTKSCTETEHYRLIAVVENEVKQENNNISTQLKHRKRIKEYNSNLDENLKKLKCDKELKVKVCNEKFHTVDLLTIFGKSVADQLRAFSKDKALLLQNKIQDIITEERLKL